MEKLLLRLARQLDAIDEASLMSLWSKYATQTSRFEPTSVGRGRSGLFAYQASAGKIAVQLSHWARQGQAPTSICPVQPPAARL